MIFKIIRKIFINDLIAGIFFTGLSYLSFLLPLSYYGKISSLVVGASFYLGVLLIGNYITLRLGGFSLIDKIFRSSREKENFIVFTCLAGIFFGFIAADLGGLWYFPYWSVTNYLIIGFALGGWAFYILTLIVCYEAGKLILDKLFSFGPVSKYYSYEKYLYPILFVVGLALLLLVGVETILNTSFFTNFDYIISANKLPYLTWPYWIAAFWGTLFVCEYLEYRKKRTSLLKDTLHGYLSPLISVLAVSFILTITNEIQNFSVFLWRYANYPFPDTMIFGIPVFIILAWPLHVIIFLEIWRAFGTNTSQTIFANDDLD